MKYVSIWRIISIYSFNLEFSPTERYRIAQKSNIITNGIVNMCYSLPINQKFDIC